MNIYDLIDTVNHTIERHINKEMEQTDAQSIGLDPRAAYMVYISEDAVACPKHAVGRFDYYGGAEYVDKEYRQEIGDYVFYLSEDSRVRGWIDRFYDRESEDEDEE